MPSPKKPKSEQSTKSGFPVIKQPKTIETMLTDLSVPLGMRLDVFRQLANAEDEAAEPIIANILEAAGEAKGGEACREKLLELAAMIEEMKGGPLRSALFDRMLDQEGMDRRAQVILGDGTLASPVVPDKGMAEKMRCGDTVWTDGKATAVLFHSSAVTTIGEEARLERVLDDGNLLLSFGIGETRAVYHCSGRLLEQIDADACARAVVATRDCGSVSVSDRLQQLTELSKFMGTLLTCVGTADAFLRDLQTGPRLHSTQRYHAAGPSGALVLQLMQLLLWA